MWIIISLVLFYLLAPFPLIHLCQKFRILKKAGAVVLAYILGLIIGNIGLLPSPSSRFREILGHQTFLPKEEFIRYFNSAGLPQSDLLANQIAGLQELLMTIVIPVALPLLLFSLNLKRWIKLAKGAVFSLILAMISLLISVFVGYYLYAGSITDSWKVSGMLVGVYTGGTPNLAAIGTALNVIPIFLF